MKDALMICNSCDFRQMVPNDPRGYCLECAADSPEVPPSEDECWMYMEDYPLPEPFEDPLFDQ